MVISEVCGELPKRYLRKKIVGGGYLRIMGETTPKSSSLPEIEVRGGKYNYLTSFYVYEYVWVLSLIGWVNPDTGIPIPWSHNLVKKDAILVQVLFHTEGTKHSIRALMGSLKPPFMIKKRLRDSFVDSLAKITGTATKLSGEITKIPSLKELGTSIEVIGELQKDTTLASHAYPWHSKMFTTIDRDKKTLLDGIEWKIDKRVFRSIGNRLVGGAGLFFVESSNAQNLTNEVRLEARAQISFKEEIEIIPEKHCVWIPEDPDPSNDKFKPLILKVNPKPLQVKSKYRQD